MKIIAFGHRRRTGKDTAGKLLEQIIRLENPRLLVRCKSFAWKLKEICFQLYAWAGLREPSYYDSYEDSKEISLPALGKSPRTIWIEVGNFLRNVYPETWINYLIRGITSCDVLIITDLRYENEAAIIKTHGGYCIKVERPEIPEYDDIADSGLKNYTNWDRILINNGTLNDLNESVKKLKKELFV